MIMDVKQAVATAREYITDLFADDGVMNLGLEEVQYDETQGEWKVTIGFSRPWDTVPGGFSALTQTNPQRPRSLKVVRVSDLKRSVISVTNK